MNVAYWSKGFDRTGNTYNVANLLPFRSLLFSLCFIRYFNHFVSFSFSSLTVLDARASHLFAGFFVPRLLQ